MKRLLKRYHPPGTPPGTLLSPHSGVASALITVTVFNPQDFNEQNFDEIQFMEKYSGQECAVNDKNTALKPTQANEDECKSPPSGTTWIHIQGAPSVQFLSLLGALFNLHPLALEDVQNTGQRPKFDTYENHHFIVTALPTVIENIVQTAQISVFLGENIVITFANSDRDPFQMIRRRLRTGGNNLRSRCADYLLYTILDLVIDEGFPVLEILAQQLDDLEETVLAGASQTAVQRIHEIKRELLVLRRMLWPQREVINGLLREDTRFVSSHTRTYLRDCYDHCVQVMDLMENYRDMASNVMDIYLTSISYKTNEVMRTLTVIATIFMPLTFLAGLYGMNFGNGNSAASPLAMPELNWYYGYPLALALMALVALAMIFYFKIKKWF